MTLSEVFMSVHLCLMMITEILYILFIGFYYAKYWNPIVVSFILKKGTKL